MTTTLTIDLDSRILHLAEQQAAVRQTTLSEIIVEQLRIMARNCEDSRAGKTPVTDSLRGAIKLPPEFDLQTALPEELHTKHGLTK